MAVGEGREGVGKQVSVAVRVAQKAAIAACRSALPQRRSSTVHVPAAWSGRRLAGVTKSLRHNARASSERARVSRPSPADALAARHAFILLVS